MTNQQLETLRENALKGDGGALSALTRALESPVYRLCLRLLGDPTDAEDAAQDVLVKVVTRLSEFEGRSALTTWVHRIAVRHVLAMNASRAEEKGLDETRFAQLLERGLQLSARLPAPGPEDTTLIQEVRLSCTQGMLMVLSRDERLALVLVDLLGLDSVEAAEVADISADAMRQRLSRARARLGNFLLSSCGLASESAACRCEKQVRPKQSMGMQLQLTRLVGSEVARSGEVAAASAELRALRAISSSFHRDGLFEAPEALHRRLTQLMPQLLQGAPRAN